MRRFKIFLTALLMALSPFFLAFESVQAVGTNLVLNPSMETINSSNTNLPLNWSKNKWGTNTTTLSYVKTNGHTGNNSVKVQTTKYTSGDAKWYFDPVSVTPGSVYIFSDYYKSNVATEVVVRVENNSGVLSYFYLGSTPASSTSWQQYSVDYTAPTDAKKITVFHLLNKVGWLQIDDVFFGLKNSAPVAPTVSITSPAANSTVSGTSGLITATAESQGATVAGVQFKIDGNNLGSEDVTAPYEAVWDTTLYANGSHSITAVARSTNGLSANSNSVVVNVNNVTVVEPTVSITSPIGGATLSDNQLITATAESQGATVAGVQFKIDGNSLGSEDVTAPYEYNWDTKSVVNGNYEITAVVRSTNGLSANSAPISVTVNNVVAVAPTVSITSPSNNSTLNGTHTIAATAESQGATVAGVQFKIDGNNLGSEDVTAPYEAVWDTTTVPNGNHEITAVVTSSNGQNATSSIINVNVNNITPPDDNENLILNPSVESVNPFNSQMPLNWNNNAWGVNTAAFSYDPAGHTGGRSITTTISSYTSGDAKWFANPVDVVPGKNYLYRDYYKSNIVSHVVVAFIDASGNYSYQYVSSAPASSDWSLYEANFVIPATASKAIVFHLIDSVGYLTIDDVLLQVGVATPSESVIPNGSLELGSSVPSNWQTNSWGTNIANFQWVNEGHSGSKSVKTTVSSYVDGDAKWFFSPISTLTPGSQYRFTTWYKTNVIPKAVAMFVNSNGVESYVGMPNPQPSGSTTDWQQYSDVFSVPQGTVAVSVFLVVNENGWLQTDDYTISEYHPTSLDRPLLTLTFDDGHEDNATTALPIMNQLGFKSTQCYATTFIENASQQAVQDVLAFYNSGHEICSHSVNHPFLTSLNDTDLNYELSHSKQYLESIIGQPVVNFASPYGDYNQHVNSVIDDYYGSHRTVDEGYNSLDNFDGYRLRVQNILDTTTAAQVSGWVEQAKLDKTWLILVYHRIANNPGPYDSYVSDFTQHMNIIKDSGITVKTWQDALVEFKSQL